MSSRTPYRAIACFAIALAAVNAVCVAACALQPCEYQKASTKRVSHCHHTGAPAGRSDSTEKQPCSHQLVVADTPNEPISPLAVVAMLEIEFDAGWHYDRRPAGEPIHAPPDPFPQLKSILRI